MKISKHVQKLNRKSLKKSSLVLVQQRILSNAPVVEVTLNGSREDNKQQHEDINCCENLSDNG